MRICLFSILIFGLVIAGDVLAQLKVNTAQVMLPSGLIPNNDSITIEWVQNVSELGTESVIAFDFRWNFPVKTNDRYHLDSPFILEWELQVDGRTIGHLAVPYGDSIPVKAGVWQSGKPFCGVELGRIFSLSSYSEAAEIKYVLLLYETPDAVWMSMPGVIENSLTESVETELLMEAYASLHTLGIYSDDTPVHLRVFPSYTSIKSYIDQLQEASRSKGSRSLKAWRHVPLDPEVYVLPVVLERLADYSIEWTHPRIIDVGFRPGSLAENTSKEKEGQHASSRQVMDLDFDEVLQEVEDRKFKRRYGDDF